MSLELGLKYKEIAEKLVDKYPVAFGHVELDKILFLKELEKKPKKHADIRKVGYPYNFMTEYKFIITFYEEVFASFTEAQIVMLVYHELLHIGEDFNKLKQHNIQDFRELITKYGVNWDIDPQLVNLLDDDEIGPTQNDASTSEDLNEDEPDIM